MSDSRVLTEHSVSEIETIVVTGTGAITQTEFDRLMINVYDPITDKVYNTLLGVAVRKGVSS